MREKDVAELWEETLERMRACFDFGQASAADRTEPDRASLREGVENGPVSPGETTVTGNAAT